VEVMLALVTNDELTPLLAHVARVGTAFFVIVVIVIIVIIIIGSGIHSNG
jgi:hypothetical protein